MISGFTHKSSQREPRGRGLWLARVLAVVVTSVIAGLSLVSVSDAPAATSPQQLTTLVKDSLSAEKSALKTLGTNNASSESQLGRALNFLKQAIASSSQNPRLSKATSELKLDSKDASGALKAVKQSNVTLARADTNQAIVHGQRALKDLQASSCAAPGNPAMPAQAQCFTLTVTTSGTGTGTVTSPASQGGISCGSGGKVCTATAPGGSTFDLVATPDSGSVFVTWTGGGCSNTASCHFVINANTTVDAQFDKPQSLTAAFSWVNAGPGEVMGSGAFQVSGGQPPSVHTVPRDVNSPLDAVEVVIPPAGSTPRQITNWLCPSQLPNASISTTNNPSDTLTCTGGSLPVGQQFSLNVQTNPAPTSGMGGQLYGRQDGTFKGPFQITGP